MDVALERVGRKTGDRDVTGAMRSETKQEPFARLAHELHTSNFVHEAGLITTGNCLFGVSADGLVGNEGVIEIKTTLSSDTLVRAVIDGDLSHYRDQCNGAMWLLGLK